MCRSARDAETVLRIIAGKDPADATAVDAPFPSARPRPRIAVVKNATKKSMPAVARNFTQSLAVLRQFADVVERFELPKHPYGATFGAIFNGECASAFRDLIESGKSRDLQSVDDKLGGYAVYNSLAVDYVDGMRLRKIIDRDVKNALEPYDAVVYPTLPTVAYPVGVPFDKVYTQYPGSVEFGSPGNLAGVPAMSVPNGFGENGLPTGLAFMSGAWNETKLTAIAKAYQSRTGFHTKRPKL
jgi:aspartyl-tRNA(Asn)/glutamyl-tRNA(Gln) amidotransferase subunit A